VGNKSYTVRYCFYVNRGGLPGPRKRSRGLQLRSRMFEEKGEEKEDGLFFSPLFAKSKGSVLLAVPCVLVNAHIVRFNLYVRRPGKSDPPEWPRQPLARSPGLEEEEDKLEDSLMESPIFSDRCDAGASSKRPDAIGVHYVLRMRNGQSRGHGGPPGTTTVSTVRETSASGVVPGAS